MIHTHEENVKLNQETGKDIPYPETVDSYFWGSFEGGQYSWGYSGIPSKKATMDNFRFLTMRITVTLPFSEKEWTYDATKSHIIIDRRSFHSGKPLKMCQKNKLDVGIADPNYSMNIRGSDGGILLNTRRDEYTLDDPKLPNDILVFQPIINNIVSQIIKTKETLPLRVFK